MSRTTRSALVGVLVGVLCVGAVAALLIWGPLDLPRPEAPRSLLVVCAVPEESGTEVAGLTFVVDTRSGEVSATDPFAAGTVPGTSAGTPREALPFGGGKTVAVALSPQTGEPDIAWIVLPVATWSMLVDEAGGIEVDVPVAISTYREGELTSLSPGPQRLSGAQTAALTSAASHLDAETRSKVVDELTASVGSVVARSGPRLSESVATGAALSSLQPEDMPVLPAKQ